MVKHALVRQFQDIHEYESWYSETISNRVHFYLLNRSPFKVDLSGFVHPHISFLLSTISGHLHEVGRISNDHLMIRLPATCSHKISWLNQDDSVDCQAAILMPGSEYELIAKTGFDYWEILIHRDLFQKFYQSKSGKNLADIQSHTQCLKKGEARKIHETLSQFQLELHRKMRDDEVFHETKEAGQLLLQILDRIPFRCCHAIEQKEPSKFALIKRFRTFIDKQSHLQSRLFDFCAKESTSIRTLEYAAKIHLGVSPKKYMRAYNLNRARRDLLSTPHSVQAIANRWGFWHMGQFSKDFRDLFGELPSSSKSKAEPI